MREDSDTALILQPPVDVNAVIIWLHGLGADGHDFEPLVPQLGLLERGVRFVFPHAESQPVTVNGGYVMPAWYDIRLPDLRREVDQAGIRASMQRIAALIAAERARGLPSERIVLAGFSQGGAIALQTGLSYPEPLAGILALSTYLPMPEVLRQEISPSNRHMNVFIGHGREDPIAPLALAEATQRELQALGCAVQWHSYAMPHSLCEAEIADIRAWLYERLA